MGQTHALLLLVAQQVHAHHHHGGDAGADDGPGDDGADGGGLESGVVGNALLDHVQHQQAGDDHGHGAGGPALLVRVAGAQGDHKSDDTAHRRQDGRVAQPAAGLAGAGGIDDGGNQHGNQEQGGGTHLPPDGGDGRKGRRPFGDGVFQERRFHQSQNQGRQEQEESNQSHQLGDLLPEPDLAVGGNGIEQIAVIGKCLIIEGDHFCRGARGEVVPGVNLAGFVNNAAAAVGGIVPGIGLGIGVQHRVAVGVKADRLQDGLAVLGGDVVLVYDAALVLGLAKEKLIIVGADLADGPPAEVGRAGSRVQPQVRGPHVVGTGGQLGADHAHARLLVGLLVIVDGSGGGEAAHGVAADRQHAVAGGILQDVVLPIHILHRVPDGRGPEAEEGAGVLRVAPGVSVVIHVQGQHHHAPAGHFNGGGVLHFGAVEVAVGSHQSGMGVRSVHSLGHVEQAG